MFLIFVFFFPLLYSLPAWKWRVCFFRKLFLKYEVTTCDFPDGPGKSELPMQGPRVQSQVMELRSCVLHRAAGKKQKHDIDGQETQRASRWLSSEESTCSAGNVALIDGLGRALGGGNGNLLQYSCLGNPMDRGACQVQSMGSQRVGHD